MTQYVINIGTFPNDGTGDPLRTAFNEVNLNFDQVFAAGPVLSNVQIANNTILTTNTNGNLILAPNGIGVVQANVNIVPNTSNIRNLGSADRRWSTLYIQYANISGGITVSDLTATGNVTVGGNLSVTGNIINVANIVTDAKTIQLANTAGTANAADGSGITVGANDAIATMLYSSATNSWVMNIGIDTPNIVVNNISSDDSTFVTVQDGLDVQGDITAETIGVTGNVTGNYILGNAAFMTGLPAPYANANAVAYGESGWAGNIIPASNTVSLGNATQVWNNIYTSNIIGQQIAITTTANNEATWTFQNLTDGNGELYFPSGLVWESDSDTNADYIKGNAGGLVAIEAYHANSEISSSIHLETFEAWIETTGTTDYRWTFDDTGNLSVPGNIVPITSNVFSLGNATNQWDSLYVSNNTIYINNVPVSIAAGNVLTVGGNAVLQNDSNTTITTTGNITADYFIGDGSQLSNVASTGNLEITGTDITIAAGAPETVINISPDPEGDAFIQIPNNDTANTANLRVVNETGNVTIETNNGTNRWTFGIDGALLFPRDADGNTDPYLAIEGGPSPTIASVDVSQEGPANLEIVALNTIFTGYTGAKLTIYPDDGDIGADGNLNIYTNTEANAENQYNWTFSNSGQTIFPTLTVTRGDRTGTLTGQALVFGDSTQEALISTPNGTSDINASQRLVINPGAGYANTTGEGGDIYLYAGRGGDAGGSGGDIKIRGGLGPVNGAGGYIDIIGGEADADGVGGYIDIQGGQSGNSHGGDINITGGQGQTSGGDANITGGYANNGLGGNVNILGGSSGLGAESYGNVNINTGNTGNTWRFDRDGKLNVPQGGYIGEAGVKGGGTMLTGGTGNIASLTSFYADAPGIYAGCFTANPDGTLNITTYGNGTGQLGQWVFDSANLTLPSGGIVYETSIPDGGLTGNTIALAPSGGTNADQQLLVYPTAGNVDANHLHLTTGNLYNTELYLGNDNLYVKLANTGNIVVNSNDDTGNTAQWNFGTDGNLTTPDGMIINGNVNTLGTQTALLQSIDDLPLSFIASGANGTVTSFWAEDFANLMTSNIAAIYTPLQNTQTVRIVTGSNGGNVAIYDFDPDGMFTAAAVCATGNVFAGNVSASGNVTGNYILGNGSQLTGIAASYGNANVATFLAAYGSNTISTTGNITAGNFVGNISLIGNVTGTTANVTLVAGVYSTVFDNTGLATFPGSLVTPPVPFANLTAVAGARAFVNNANLVATGNFGSQISGGGANTVPVWSDGSNWYIG